MAEEKIKKLPDTKPDMVMKIEEGEISDIANMKKLLEAEFIVDVIGFYVWLWRKNGTGQD